ncbi:hypothetical protein OSB04_013295 [Centaurea solstitialis]|uniref:Uncharacterized protein n=1 Tax=Centaurea solstitialis TaxID=347529 RepID=A0AA38WR69_9ASTR|nr:hypothetical protein OSB04_013295 [Centaurea solstitialis]
MAVTNCNWRSHDVSSLSNWNSAHRVAIIAFNFGSASSNSLSFRVWYSAKQAMMSIASGSLRSFRVEAFHNYTSRGDDLQYRGNISCESAIGSTPICKISPSIAEALGLVHILVGSIYDATKDIDEKSIRTEKLGDLVLALVEAKADAIISRLGITGHKEQNSHPTLLITTDTVVACEGMIQEKPSSKEEACHFIKCLLVTNCFYSEILRPLRYSGGCAIVVGSILIADLTIGIKKRGWDRSEVYFHDIPDEVIDKPVRSSTPAEVHCVGFSLNGCPVRIPADVLKPFKWKLDS